MKMKEKNKLGTDILVGGQAVIEGVMMRTPRAFSVAVRKPDGEIVMRKESVPKWTDRFPILKWPLVRGCAILIQSLVLGIKALNFSAEVAMVEEEKSSGDKSKNSKKQKQQKSGSSFAVIGSIVFSLVAGVAFFVLVPYWLSGIITTTVHNSPSTAAGVQNNWLFFNLVDGLIRVTFFLGYILVISLMKDIKRVFLYHGAEHKVVYLWESKKPLTVENARPFTTLHPRCGTSFLLFVMVVSIIVFTLFKFDWWVMKIVARIILLPLIAGISYELIRLSAKFPKNPFFKALVTPGLLLQKITTGPPDDEMLEVSLAALKGALSIEEKIDKKRGLPIETA